MLRPREERPDVLAEYGFAADGDGVKGCAGERNPTWKRFLWRPVAMRASLEGDADGAGASRAQEDLVEVARGDPCQSFGKIDRNPVGVAPGTEGEAVELLLYGGYDVGIREAHLVHVVSVEVHVTPSLEVFDVDPAACAHGVETGSRERLAEEIARVFLQERTRVVIEMFLLPCLAVWRNIDVAFRSVWSTHESLPCTRTGGYL